MKIHKILFVLSIFSISTSAIVYSQSIVTAPPRQSSLELFDLGYARVLELRMVSLPTGESVVRIPFLPSSLDASSTQIKPIGESQGFQILSEQFIPSSSDLASFVKKNRGQIVDVVYGGVSSRGKLLSGHRNEIGSFGVLIEAEAGNNWIEDVDSIRVRNAEEMNSEGSSLVWNVSNPVARQATFRLEYLAQRWDWDVSYLAVLNFGSNRLKLSSRVGLKNNTDQGYVSSRVTLIETEKGREDPLFTTRGDEKKTRLRYMAGSDAPVFEQQIASIRELSRFDLPNRIDLPAQSSVYVTFLEDQDLPFTLEYIYDGVLFDRFQRNRRNDWNYGTESHGIVDLYLSMDSLGMRQVTDHLPGGQFRVFEETAEGNLKLLGDQAIGSLPLDEPLNFRIGAASQVKANRERIGYAEISPLHEYEESFEIRLENVGEQDVTVRVVEHAYRWPEYEVVKADAEFKETDEQNFEFLIPLKSKGTRTIHYTIRYRW